MCASGRTQAQVGGSVAIREDFQPGYTYHVECRVNIKGELVLPVEKGQTQPKRLDVKGKSVINYDERILEHKGGVVDRTVRFYHRMEFDRQIGVEAQRGGLRKEARLLVILRHNQYEVPFSPHGPLLWEEIDLVRTDVFNPALGGLLPSSKVSPGDSWFADLAAVQELTDLEQIKDGNLRCKFTGVKQLGGRSFATITFKGTVTGVGEDGPAQHEISGFLEFDLGSNHVSYLTVEGIQHLLDKYGSKTGGRIEGSFVLVREPGPCSAVGDAALKGLKLQPDDENTLLWFVNPEVGASFVYPRHWHIGGVNSGKRQIGLDEKRGSGILITVDGIQNLPTIAKLQQEVQADLLKQQAKILKTEPPRTLTAGLETFGVDAEIAGKRTYLQYYLVRQKGAYAVLTANLQLVDAVALQKDVERVARSLVVLPPAK